MTRCCVEQCPNTNEDKIYFSFPASKTLLRKWLGVTPIKEKVTIDSVICHQHFKDDDYEFVRGKNRLKAKVVPSVFNFRKSTSPQRDPARDLVDFNDEIPATTIDKTTLNQTETIDKKTLNQTETIDKKTLNQTETVDKNTLNQTETIDKNTLNQTETIDKNTLNQTDTIDKKTLNQTDTIDQKTLNQTDTIDERPETGNDCGQNTDIVKRLEPNLSLAEAHNDIEEIITNYQIKQTRPIDRGVDAGAKDGERDTDQNGERDGEGNGERVEKEQAEERVENDVVTIEEDADPVYIEVNVDKGGGGGGDCLMVLESVQCEVDPGLFDEGNEHEMDRDSDVVDLGERKEDPISLLTSSDEDDVVIEEPYIDTVEVSDSDSDSVRNEDDDDLPLVKLVPGRTENGPSDKQWELYQYYCIECTFTTEDRAAYKRHVNGHATVLQVCQVCGYTTASKAQYARHKRKHRDEKKYRCHLCDYRARHNMSLIYHLKSHDGVIGAGKYPYQCTKCAYRSNAKSGLLKHIRVCADLKHVCDRCNYRTKRESDLKKHQMRRHKQSMTA